MGFGRPLVLALLAAGLLPCLDAGSAQADTIRLKTGRTLEVEALEVREGRFLVTLQQDGAPVQVEFAFEQFAPRTVLSIYDRYTDTRDVDQRLRGAWIALEVGLLQEAERRFRDAQMLDPTRSDDVEEGIEALRFAAAAQAFQELEDRLRAGKDPEAVHEALEALLVGPHALYLSVAQLRRIEVLSRLARQLAERAEARKAQERKKNEPRKRPPDPTPDDPPPPPRPPGDTEGGTRPPGSYADERWRERRGPRPAPPVVPGRERPPLQGGGGDAGPKGGVPGGGSQGGPFGK